MGARFPGLEEAISQIATAHGCRHPNDGKRHSAHTRPGRCHRREMAGRDRPQRMATLQSGQSRAWPANPSSCTANSSHGLCTWNAGIQGVPTAPSPADLHNAARLAIRTCCKTRLFPEYALAGIMDGCRRCDRAARQSPFSPVSPLVCPRQYTSIRHRNAGQDGRLLVRSCRIHTPRACGLTFPGSGSALSHRSRPPGGQSCLLREPRIGSLHVPGRKACRTGRG